MQEEHYWWAPPLGAVLVVVVISTIALVAGGGWTLFLGVLTGQAASWVQAIGAVIAVVAAYNLGLTQIKAGRLLQEEKDRNEAKGRAHVIEVLLATADGYCNVTEVAWDRRGVPPVHLVPRQAWIDVRNAIAKIDPFQCPPGELLMYLVQIPRLIDDVISGHDAFLTAIGDAPPNFRSDGRSLNVRSSAAKFDDGLQAAHRCIREARSIVAQVRLRA